MHQSLENESRIFKTPQSRRLFVTISLIGVAAISVGILKKTLPPYRPEAPAYRHKGPSDAPVIIVEFSDFQCPSCRNAAPPLHQLMARYSGKIQLIFKHLPLERVHRWARAAATATECAGQQGKFWELHDRLLLLQPIWSKADNAPQIMESYASELGLNLSEFNACRSQDEVQSVINDDIQEASGRMIKLTPTFFINGKRFVGAAQLVEGGHKEIRRLLNISDETEK